MFLSSLSVQRTEQAGISISTGERGREPRDVTADASTALISTLVLYLTCGTLARPYSLRDFSLANFCRPFLPRSKRLADNLDAAIHLLLSTPTAKPETCRNISITGTRWSHLSTKLTPVLQLKPRASLHKTPQHSRLAR